MSTKHIFNSSEGLVLKSLRGAVALNPSLRLHSNSKSVYLASPPRDLQVAVVSGGGAGHEPAHAGYTGAGMLAASVSGDIFASPSASAILSTLTLAMFSGSEGGGTRAQPRDVLVVINNYTGDRLNFGLALEKARARFPDARLASVVVADDVSLLRPAGGAPAASLVGPRGLGGNILVCKLLGAYAAAGASLDAVKALGDAVVANLASVGVGLEHCHVPGRTRDGKGADSLGEDECEIGLGLHNEPGVRRTHIGKAADLVGEVLQMILTSRALGDMHSFIGSGDETVLFVNNLGGMSQLEMSAVLDEALDQLATVGIIPLRIYMSSYMTSLNAPGFSFSLLNVSAVEAAHPADVAALLDAPTDAAAWAGVRNDWPARGSKSSRKNQEEEADALLAALSSLAGTPAAPEAAAEAEENWWRRADVSPELARAGIAGACAAALAAEADMTRFDTVVGDGDCGETFAAGARAVLKALDSGMLDVGALHPATVVRRIGDILEASMGGTIGALFALFFTAWSARLSSPPPADSGPWPASSLSPALRALGTHTPARPGDRTLVDALAPLCAALAAGDGLRAAARAAREGAEGTRGMHARLGRAAYVGAEGDGLPPDPGAWGVAALAEGFCDGLAGQGAQRAR